MQRDTCPRWIHWSGLYTLIFKLPHIIYPPIVAEAWPWTTELLIYFFSRAAKLLAPCCSSGTHRKGLLSSSSAHLQIIEIEIVSAPNLFSAIWKEISFRLFLWTEIMSLSAVLINVNYSASYDLSRGNSLKHCEMQLKVAVEIANQWTSCKDLLLSYIFPFFFFPNLTKYLPETRPLNLLDRVDWFIWFHDCKQQFLVWRS